MSGADRIPVILGIGEAINRSAEVATSVEPIALMESAILAADRDCGGKILDLIESLEVIGFTSWRYANPVDLLCAKLGISPARQINASMGGDTPTRLVHEAAVRIASGQQAVAAIVGGESTYSRSHARRAGAALPWTPMANRDEAVAFPSSRFSVSEVALRLGIRDPVQIYPFYELAAQQAWRQTPAEAHAASAELWAQYAAVAAGNATAWLRDAPTAREIGEISPNNRLINFPYPKFMVANPNVNQGAAVIVASLAVARQLGVEDRAIHIWGGGYAAEREDYLRRDRYDHSTAQAAVLDRARQLVGGDAKAFARMELYSCFPVVPKMAIRNLGLDGHAPPPTVTGGLSFFGGPLNNYMTHAVCAMVRKLRDHRDEIGLLYGQGGYVNKHHSLVLSARPAPEPLQPDFSVQEIADAHRAPVPEVLDIYEGPAQIETYTVSYGRDGTAMEGVVILRTDAGARTMARVDELDRETLILLEDMDRSAIGVAGHVRIDPFGKPLFEAGPLRAFRDRALRFCRVERDGPLTTVTLDRPDVLNALTPAANAELCEVFDDFAADPAQWVAIITGSGRAFSAGNDLKAMAQAIARGAPIDHPAKGFAGLTSRYDLDKPVIAAVNGSAFGGGFEIALACDIVIAAEEAVFALPEPQVGVAALAGGLHRLPRQIGLKRAMGMILTGDRIGAREAYRIGFVNEVAPAGEALSVARAWAERILQCSPMAIRASKAVVTEGLEAAALPDAMARQAGLAAVKALFGSADFREGPLAFAQKRRPRWSGR